MTTHSDYIGDSGIVEKRDTIGIIFIVICFILIGILIALATMALTN